MLSRNEFIRKDARTASNQTRLDTYHTHKVWWWTPQESLTLIHCFKGELYSALFSPDSVFYQPKWLGWSSFLGQSIDLFDAKSATLHSKKLDVLSNSPQ